jgi:hypothetical protein
MYKRYNTLTHSHGDRQKQKIKMWPGISMKLHNAKMTKYPKH